MQWLLVKYVLKELLLYLTLEENCPRLAPKDVNIWKPADQVDIGSAAKLQIAEYKKKATYKKSKIHIFCNEVMVLYATTASHFVETSSTERYFCSIYSMFLPLLHSKESR